MYKDDPLKASGQHNAELLGTGLISLRSLFSSAKPIYDVQLMNRSGEKLGNASLMVRKFPKDAEGAVLSTSSFRLDFQGRQLPFISASLPGGFPPGIQEFGVCVDLYQRTYSSGKFAFVGQTELSIGSENVEFQHPVVLQRQDNDDAEVLIAICFLID